jgi:hypothetical protein
MERRGSPMLAERLHRAGAKYRSSSCDPLEAGVSPEPVEGSIECLVERA